MASLADAARILADRARENADEVDQIRIAMVVRLAEILENPDTPLSNIDRVSRELRHVLSDLIGVETSGSDLSDDELEELLHG